MANRPDAELHIDSGENLPLIKSRNSELNPIPNPSVTLLHISFNQDYSCFAVGTDAGFLIFQCEPFKLQLRRDFLSKPLGAVGFVEMLHRSQILGLVGSKTVDTHPLQLPMFDPNKLTIWNDYESRCMAELTFRSEVRSVRLRSDYLVVVLQHRVFVYSFSDLKLIQQIETAENPKGLCEVSNSVGPMLLVTLGTQKGHIRIENYGSKRIKFVVAHDSRIACLGLTWDGRLLATASSKGTLIRVFNALDGSLLQEVRRGSEKAEIYSLAFSSTLQWLAASSNQGTVHVFSLNVVSGIWKNDGSYVAAERSTTEQSSNSSLSLLKGILPKYFTSERSVAQFRLLEGMQYIVCFGSQKDTILIVGVDGSFSRCQFDPTEEGEMKLLERQNFLKLAEETIILYK